MAVINDYCSEGAERGKIQKKGWGNKMKKRKIETKTTKQIAIDKGLHQLVKTEASKVGKSIKEFVEECLIEVLGLVIDTK